MNKLVIPPSVNWFEPNAAACTLDNTIVYASRNDVVVVYPAPVNEPAEVQILPRSHTDRVVSVATSPIWDKNIKRYIVSAADDKTVRLWDLNKNCFDQFHSAHTTRSDRLVGATFAGSDRIVSVSEEGYIVIWRYLTKELNSLNNILGSKVKVTCISSCPHATWLTAFGLKQGVIFVADLRGNGKVLHKFCGHENRSVVSLSWCPIPYNVFPAKKKLQGSSDEVTKNVKISLLRKAPANSLIDEGIAEANVDIQKYETLDRLVQLGKTLHERRIIDDNLLLNEDVQVPVALNTNESLSESPKKKINNASDCFKKCFTDERVNALELSDERVQSIFGVKDILFEEKPIGIIAPSSAKDEIGLIGECAVEANCDIEKSMTAALDFSVQLEKTLHKQGTIDDTLLLNESLSESSKEELNSFCAEASDLNISLDSSKKQLTEEQKEVLDSLEDQLKSVHDVKEINSVEQKSVETIASNLAEEEIVSYNNTDPNLIGLTGDTTTSNITPTVENNRADSDGAICTPDTTTAEITSCSTHDNTSVPNIPDVDVVESLLLDVSTINPQDTLTAEFATETAANEKEPLQEVESQPCDNQEDLQTEVDESIPDSVPTNAIIEDVADEFEQVDCTSNELVKEYLLASSVQGGKSIIIWRAGTDGQKQTELYFSGRNRNQGGRNRKDDSAWISLCWLKPRALLSSSPKNELIEWNLLSATSNSKSANKWRLIHGDHTGCIFNIVAPYRKYEFMDIEDWRDKHLLHAWTFGKDRLILNTSLSSNRETLALYPTFAGGVHSILPSTLNPSRMAVASGDGSCRLWDLTSPHRQYIAMPTILEKSKVSSMTWHPSNDVLLAFGTAEGKVALMDTSNITKKPTYLVHYVHLPVLKMEWGPLNGDINNLGLYVVCNGKLVVYDISKPLNRPLEINVCNDDENSIYSFAWKPGYSICAVGTMVGTVILASIELQCLATLYLDTKCIKCLAWHCEATADVSSVSSCANWLALTGTDLKIFDCSLNEPDGLKQENNYYKNIIATFAEHTGVITHLSWSPHQEGILASASEDGSVLVWNIKTKTLMYCCRKTNLDTILCVTWSPISADFIITGSKDSTLQIWQLPENLPKEKICKRTRKKVLKPKVVTADASEISGAVVESGGGGDQCTVFNESRRLRKNVLAGFAHIQNAYLGDVGYRNCKQMFDHFVNKGTCPLNETLENDAGSEINVPAHNAERGIPEMSITQLFGNREDVNSLLEVEKAYQSKTKWANSYEHICLWQGNIGDCIKRSITEESLNPWLVALAPMVSPSLWQEACAAYAEQLSKDLQKDPFLVSSYYLACHKTEAAIETLCASNKYREALALAKIRLLEDDPLINSILERWAKRASQTGNFDVAAQCLMALNQIEEAAKILFKRFDTKSLKLAAELAVKCGNKDLLDAINYKLTSVESPKPTNDGTSSAESANPSNNEVLAPLVSRAQLELQLAGADAKDDIESDVLLLMNLQMKPDNTQVENVT